MDKAAFEGMLEDLHCLTERMHELMGNYRANQIQDTTTKTFREMVFIRNSVTELRDMLDAVTGLIEISTRTTPSVTHHTDNSETLQDLLRLKKIKSISDFTLLKSRGDAELDLNQFLGNFISVRRYDGPLFRDCFTHVVTKGAKPEVTPDRPRGVLTNEVANREVWVEWREASTSRNGSIAERETIIRTASLAQMLAAQKPHQFLSPTRIGYVDDRAGQGRFGWIFAMPEGSDGNTSLRTLRSMLGQSRYRPTLPQRISLAHRLASSLLYLHTVGWLHKAIYSANVIFTGGKGALDIEAPVLSGFEYSRPESDETTSRGLDPRWDIYRWPGIQTDVPRASRSRKTYDIFSLGLLLLEIAHWQPLHILMSLKRWPDPSPQNARIRGWLLEEEGFPPFQDANPLVGLRHVMGDRYWRATQRCILAHGESGMRVEEDGDESQSSGTEIELHTAFTDLVVEELKGVVT